jgi:hypothetical protein
MQLYGQLNPGKPVPSFPTILSNMIKHDGLLSIYKGVDAAIGRQLVYGTARIGLHRKFSDKLVEWNDGKSISFVGKALSGMASGSIAVCIGTPFDIALVRLQADGMAKVEDRRNYKNVFDVSEESTKKSKIVNGERELQKKKITYSRGPCAPFGAYGGVILSNLLNLTLFFVFLCVCPFGRPYLHLCTIMYSENRL